MKHINGQSSKQSSFLLNSCTNQYSVDCNTSFHPCNFGKDRQGEEIQHQNNSKPLLSYLFFSGENSKVEENNQEYRNRSNSCNIGKNQFKYQEQDHVKYIINNPPPLQKHLKNKRKTQNQRFKTDIKQEYSPTYQLQNLKHENKILKQQIIRNQKTIISLQSNQSQLQYIRKLSYLQQSQIQKLRYLLRKIQIENVQKGNSSVYGHFKSVFNDVDVKLDREFKKQKQNLIFNTGIITRKNSQKRKMLKNSKDSICQPRNTSHFFSKDDHFCRELPNKKTKKLNFQSSSATKTQKKKFLS